MMVPNEVVLTCSSESSDDEVPSKLSDHEGESTGQENPQADEVMITSQL